MLHKQIILEINNVYTANAFQTGTGYHVGAGSETDPVVHLYDLKDGRDELVDDCPGGMMSFIPIPGTRASFVTIMGLYPPFIGHEAGLFLHQKGEAGWTSVKTMDLPFAHRCEFMMHEGVNYLVAATVSKLKENPDDWSRPGELHILSMATNVVPPWKSKIIESGITRNHGMTKTIIDGNQTICISGAEGIFKIIPRFDGQWEIKPVI